MSETRAIFTQAGFNLKPDDHSIHQWSQTLLALQTALTHGNVSPRYELVNTFLNKVHSESMSVPVDLPQAYELTPAVRHMFWVYEIRVTLEQHDKPFGRHLDMMRLWLHRKHKLVNEVYRHRATDFNRLRAIGFIEAWLQVTNAHKKIIH